MRTAVAPEDEAEGHARRAREDPRRSRNLTIAASQNLNITISKAVYL
jgi:hypothetical protein